MPNRILVVDDDPYFRLQIAEILGGAGFDFDTVVDGNAALRVLDDEEPDLLLVDLTMPTTDGWRLIREVRANPSTRELPIVVMSEHVAISNLTCFGVQSSICKPIDAVVMLDILNELLIQEIAA
jgi:CheY-like chemotaxis protein